MAPFRLKIRADDYGVHFRDIWGWFPRIAEGFYLGGFCAGTKLHPFWGPAAALPELIAINRESTPQCILSPRPPSAIWLQMLVA